MVLNIIPPDRVKCRRCGAKLPKPTSNELEAFCCRGCFRIYYSKRCLICEEASAKLLCDKRKCRIAYSGRKRHATLGRFYPRSRSIGGSANPIKIGVPIIGPTDVPINLVGGYRFPGAKIESLPASLRKWA
jgi:hypothetical protein